LVNKNSATLAVEDVLDAVSGLAHNFLASTYAAGSWCLAPTLAGRVVTTKKDFIRKIEIDPNPDKISEMRGESEVQVSANL
jgi:hypothetical protein